MEVFFILVFATDESEPKDLILPLIIDAINHHSHHPESILMLRLQERTNKDNIFKHVVLFFH